ncbi:hypothetical protein HOV93_05430 [Planctomycetes bacterium FF15]|uniref:Uncharacterized protein n=1 Tax=Bremerella alba TaxID=980252 RepID=A0A7V8V2F0_9BACT|nr:hypothetical protein [Bremerella alba]
MGSLIRYDQFHKFRREQTRQASRGRVKLTIMIGLGWKFTPLKGQVGEESAAFFHVWYFSDALANF